LAMKCLDYPSSLIAQIHLSNTKWRNKCWCLLQDHQV